MTFVSLGFKNTIVSLFYRDYKNQQLMPFLVKGWVFGILFSEFNQSLYWVPGSSLRTTRCIFFM